MDLKFLPKDIETIINNYKFQLDYDVRVKNHKKKFKKTINQINDMYMIQLKEKKIIYLNKISIRMYPPVHTDIIYLYMRGEFQYMSIEEFYTQHIRKRRNSTRFDFIS